MANRTKLPSKEFNEFMYDLCYNLTFDMKKSLSLNRRRMLESEAKTKNFCFTSTYEEKFLFLREIGMSFSVSVYPDKLKNGKDFTETFQKYKKNKTVSATNDFTQLNVFVFTDKEVEFYANLIAQSIHSKSFLLNLDYNKVAGHPKDWSKRLNNKDQLELVEMEESIDTVAKMVFNSVISSDSLEIQYRIKTLDMLLLIFYFINKHAYISEDRVFAYFSKHNFNKKNITCSIHRIYRENLTRLHAESKVPKHTITATGINLVMTYCKQITKDTILI